MGSRKHVNGTKLTPRAYRRAERRGLRQHFNRLLLKDLTPQVETRGNERFSRMTDVRAVKIVTTRRRILSGRQDGARQVDITADRLLDVLEQAAA